MKEPKVWTPERIRELRTQVLKMSLAEMGAHLGVHGNTVSRWESGTMKPTFATQRRMSEIVREVVAA